MKKRLLVSLLLLALAAGAAEDFFKLCQKGTLEEVQAAIKAGADVNAKDKYGGTPLLWAVQYNKQEVVEALIVAGADLQAKTKSGESALMCAYGNHDEHLWSFLGKAGLRFSRVDRREVNLLIENKKYVEAIRLLRAADDDLEPYHPGDEAPHDPPLYRLSGYRRLCIVDCLLKLDKQDEARAELRALYETNMMAAESGLGLRCRFPDETNFQFIELETANGYADFDAWLEKNQKHLSEIRKMVELKKAIANGNYEGTIEVLRYLRCRSESYKSGPLMTWQQQAVISYMKKDERALQYFLDELDKFSPLKGNKWGEGGLVCSIGEIGNPKAIPSLLKTKGRTQNGYVQLEYVAALAKCGYKPIAPELLSGLWGFGGDLKNTRRTDELLRKLTGKAFGPITNGEEAAQVCAAWSKWIKEGWIAELEKELVPPVGTAKSSVDAVYGEPKETKELPPAGKGSQIDYPLHTYTLLPPVKNEEPRVALNVSYREGKVWRASINYSYVVKGRVACVKGSPEALRQRNELVRENSDVLRDLEEIRVRFAEKLKAAAWNLNRAQKKSSNLPGSDKADEQKIASGQVEIPHCPKPWEQMGKAIPDLPFYACWPVNGIPRQNERFLDQAQLVYNGGLSARMLPGCSFWQSFTPSRNGELVQIDLGFFNEMSGEGRFSVYAGEGIKGELLYSAKVSVKAIDANVNWNFYAVKATVVAGKKYTFHFVPTPETLPDPYGVCIGARDATADTASLYAGGIFAIGKSKTSMQSVFRTYVVPTEPAAKQAIKKSGTKHFTDLSDQTDHKKPGPVLTDRDRRIERPHWVVDNDGCRPFVFCRRRSVRSD